MSTSQGSAVVGFLGLGTMGQPMAARALASGHRLAVFDVNRDAMHALGDAASASASPRELADRATVIVGCLPSLPAYRDAVLGAEGIVHGTSVRTYIHVGTTGSAFAVELAAGLRKAGIAMCDAPISGGRRGAMAGTLTTMASGERTVLDAVMPILRCYSGRVIDLGESIGAAQTMKLVNNMISAANLAAACEALVVGAKAGLAPATMLEVLNASTGQNSATLSKIPQHVLPRTFDFGGALRIILKDQQAYLDEAERLNVPAPIGAAIWKAYREAVERGSLDDDMTAVVRPMERAAGVELTRSQAPAAQPRAAIRNA